MTRGLCGWWGTHQYVVSLRFGGSGVVLYGHSSTVVLGVMGNVVDAGVGVLES
jgi:hypothetical protein